MQDRTCQTQVVLAPLSATVTATLFSPENVLLTPKTRPLQTVEVTNAQSGDPFAACQSGDLFRGEMLWLSRREVWADPMGCH